MQNLLSADSFLGKEAGILHDRTFLARLHEVQRAIVATTVVSVLPLPGVACCSVPVTLC